MTIRDELEKKPISRQKRYQIRRYRAGECINCGKPRTKRAGARNNSHYLRLCETCGQDRTKKNKKVRQARARE